MTAEQVKERLRVIIENSGKGNYELEGKMNLWENYGKSRTYIKIVETSKLSKHYIERQYGYIDNKTGEYFAGKNDLTKTITLTALLFRRHQNREELEHAAQNSQYIK